MSCLTNFSNKAVRLLFCFFAATSWGCAAQEAVNSVDVSAQEGGQQTIGVEPQEKNGPFSDILIAFLPFENLSGTRAPLKEIEEAYRAGLSRRGFNLLDSELLEQFRKKHRMRYTGGVSSILSEALRKEMDVDAIMITSLEAFNEINPPQISIISRLVTSGRQPEIVWMDSIGLSGDQSPGLLDLTLVRDPKVLMVNAVEGLASSFASSLLQGIPNDEASLPGLPGSGGAIDPGTLTAPRYSLNKKYLPYDYFRSQALGAERKYSIAVIPMNDLAVRKNAGRIASLHYVRELFNLTDYKVIEPGLVREQLLRFRAIMPAGPSLAVADLITSDSSLGVDLVLSGKVFDYQNSSSNPKVDFSVHVIEKKSRKVVFGARTFSAGRDGVFFYNFGRVFTAHNLLQEMSRVTVQLLDTPYTPGETTEEFIADYPPGKDAENYAEPDWEITTGEVAENKLQWLYWE